ncbi:MAG: hypothetical protein ACI86H_001997 [bacterium]|jgi:hypothetical protein
MMSDIDLGKMNCQTFGSLMNSLPADQRKLIVVWLEGYLSGKTNDTVIDIDLLMKSIAKFEKYCKNNPDEMVLVAAENVLSK